MAVPLLELSDEEPVAIYKSSGGEERGQPQHHHQEYGGALQKTHL
jgi:hypothetical protein